MRYEIKYQIALVDRFLIDQSILNHPASFTKAFPKRRVNNIYFDSPDLYSFYQNINGDPDRTKVRYRWYGDVTNFNNGRVELKKKKKELGFKEYIDISDSNNIEHEIRKKTFVGLPPFLKATLKNAYDRTYYVSQNQKFRITIDENLEFSKANSAHFKFKEEDIIMEIKFDQNDFDLFDAINKYLPFRQTKYSKYARGITKLYF